MTPSEKFFSGLLGRGTGSWPDDFTEQVRTALIARQVREARTAMVIEQDSFVEFSILNQQFERCLAVDACLQRIAQHWGLNLRPFTATIRIPGPMPALAAGIS